VEEFSTKGIDQIEGFPAQDLILTQDLLRFCKTNFLVRGKLKFQITNQQITIQTKFTGLKIEDIPKKKICSNVHQNLLHPIFQFKISQGGHKFL
jgi:hypothetical protein